MPPLETVMQTELEALTSIQQQLRQKIGNAGLEQRARFAELDAQFNALQLTVATGQTTPALLEGAGRLRGDMDALSNYIGGCWAIRMSA